MTLIERVSDRLSRSIWARTNSDTGFKTNSPDGWVTDNGPVWWYGSDSVSSLTTNQQGSGLAAITKACSIIVNRIAVSLWTVGPEVMTDSEVVELAGRNVPRWVSDPMLTRSDERYPGDIWAAPLRLPAPLFWGQWIRSALMWGMGWLIYAEDSNGKPWPGSMHVLGPFDIEANNSMYSEAYRVVVKRDGTRIPLDNNNRFTMGNSSWRLLELRNPTTPLDTATGLTPGNIQYHALEMGLLPAIANYSAGIFNGSGVPSGYLKVMNPQLTQPQADELKAQWLRSHGGGKRSVAVLPSTMEYTPLSVSPVDAALAEMKRLSLVDVANAFCVPLFMLGAPSGHSNVYSNVETEQKALWIHTLIPWARAVESTLSTLLPVGTNLKISLPSIEGMPG